MEVGVAVVVGAVAAVGVAVGVGLSLRQYKLWSSDPNTVSPDCVVAGLEPTEEYTHDHNAEKYFLPLFPGRTYLNT